MYVYDVAGNETTSGIDSGGPDARSCALKRFVTILEKTRTRTAPYYERVTQFMV